MQRTDEILAIRRNHYRWLVRTLLLLGFTSLLMFGIQAVRRQEYLLGALLLTPSLILGALLILHYIRQHERLERILITVTALVLTLYLLITGGSENTGLYWVAPMLTITICVNRLHHSLLLTGVTVLMSTLLLLTPLSDMTPAGYSQVESIRFVITLGILSAISLAMVYFNEQATDSILQIHNEDVQRLAYYDPLTGLANRVCFQRCLELLLPRAREYNHRMALLYIDLDDFKSLNDKYGHTTGDRLLAQFGQRIREITRVTDPVTLRRADAAARVAGDELAVLLPAISQKADAAAVAERILTVCQDGIVLDEVRYPISVSIGISCFPDDGQTADQLLNHTEASMYHAKRDGKNRFQFYSAQIADAQREHQRILDGLSQALEGDQFSLAYMPIYHGETRAVAGVEILLRCHSPQLRGVGPDRFIPVAESSGLIQQLDLWVMERAFASLAELRQTYRFDGLFCVNISANELHNDAFPEQVEQLLNKYQLDPAQVELELTETSLVASDQRSIKLLERLKALGISLSLDDFGTGYTAFNQLANYPVDCLKIDRSFVNDLFSAEHSRHQIVNVICNLAELYRLRLVAEGVETEKQSEYLRQLGCHWQQGYYLSEPLSREAFTALL